MTTVHTQPAYQISSAAPAPPGYPAHPYPDAFSETPFLPDYEARRQAFFDHLLRNPAPANTKAGWYELARLAAGGTPHEGLLHACLDFIDARKDCSDFVLHGILRLLYQFGGQATGAETQPALSETRPRSPSPGHKLSPQLLARARQTVLSFKYFPSEPGLDSLCTWTENHYLLFTSAAYLAGQLYPQETFSNSAETGLQKVAANRVRLLRWLDLRFRTGFSEWLSPVYYDEDLAALLSLYDFAADEQIRRQAETAIHLLLLDLALSNFKGVFGAASGRAYGDTKRWASQAGVTDTYKLLFGSGIFSGYDNMSAIAFALSRYRPPPAIAAIAADQARPEMLNRQRMGIKVGEAARWGLQPGDFESGMHLLTLEAYFHPHTAGLTLRMFDAFNWWENSFFGDVKAYRPLLRFLRSTRLLKPLLRAFEWDVCRNTREQVDIVTYRTPDYMLSSAPDYRPGYGGDQQHIWQATLAPDAVCFTTHPGRIGGPTPDEWAGSGLLPRLAQVKNVLIAVYRLSRKPALYIPTRHFYTHAWLPQAQFDQVVERAGWIFARKGDGYLALRSQSPYRWAEDRCEVIVEGARNIWLCELGRRAVEGDFAAFITRLLAAPLAFTGLNVRYHSPSQGVLRFGWRGVFTQNGQTVDLHPDVRYDNPYVQAAFDPRTIQVRAGGHELTLKRSETEKFS